MDIPAILIAFWLVLIGIYGAMSLASSSRRKQEARRRVARTATPGAGTRRLGGLVSEVDMLRLKVENLQAEVVALSTPPESRAYVRPRRARTGHYSELPSSLRRHVRQVRNIRHPLGV